MRPGVDNQNVLYLDGMIYRGKFILEQTKDDELRLYLTVAVAQLEFAVRRAKAVQAGSLDLIEQTGDEL